MKPQVFSISIVLLALLGCDHSTQPKGNSPPGQLTTLEKSVVASDNSFGFKLFSQLNTVEQNKNVFISPFSVSMAFGMLLNGANGATLDSLKKALEHTNYSLEEINNSYKNISAALINLDPAVKFQIANSIWYRLGFAVRPKFLDDNKTYFDAEVSELDFASPTAVETINSWVNAKTNGKIQTILKEISRDDVMYLINAIYFKGTWTYQFKPEQTKDTTFTSADGTTVPCKMMSQRATYAYYSDGDVQIIDIPYGGRKFSMTVILPRQASSVEQFAEDLTQSQWDSYISKLDSSEVDLFLPKFKLEYEKELKDELITMGMGIAFSDFADFSRIANEPLAISKVKHKTFIEVNEEGTEAAAVTLIGIIRTSVPSTLTMRIDRPFIFAIREHDSGTILFIGKIVEPK